MLYPQSRIDVKRWGPVPKKTDYFVGFTTQRINKVLAIIPTEAAACVGHFIHRFQGS